MPDILLNQSCDECKYQLVLKIYISSRSKELTNELKKQNCKNICLAFADEGIAEIGPFNSLGCECFEKQTDKFTEIKEDVRIRQDLEFL